MAIQKIKLDLGTVYQKEEGGIYYFRYQVNGARKAISLKTRNQKENSQIGKEKIDFELFVFTELATKLSPNRC